MNIWVIGRSFPTKQNSMRGSFEVEQAHLLASRGHKVTYLATILHPINKVKKWGFNSFDDGDVKVYTYSLFWAPERMHLHPKKILIGLWNKILSAAEKEQGFPDVIHIHYPGMNSIPEAILPYQARGCKIVITDHWSKTLKNTMDKFQRKQLITYANKADEVLCVGEPLKRALIKVTQTPKEVKVVPNIVSNIFSLKKKENSGDTFKYIVVGRLVSLKQIDKVIVAFAETFADNKNVQLAIVGGGKEESNLKDLIKQYNMEDQVKLLGTLPRKETAKQVEDADALICYSKFETFGVPVIEAWACGKPAIISDALGFTEYFSDDLGYIVDHNNINELKEAMLSLYSNYNKYDNAGIAKFAQDNFGEETIYNKLIEIYSSES